MAEEKCGSVIFFTDEDIVYANVKALEVYWKQKDCIELATQCE